MFAEFRVYVQVHESQDRNLSRMRDFIRTCIQSLDGVIAVEVEPPRGSVPENANREVLGTGTPRH